MSSFERAQPAKNLPMRGNLTSGMDRIWNVPRASVYRAATASVVSATPTQVAWDTLEYDTDGMWSTATPSALTCRTAGIYLIVALGQFAGNVASFRLAYIRKTAAVTGTVTTYEVSAQLDTAGIGTVLHGAWPVPMFAGDVVEFTVQQNTGGNLTFQASSATVRVNGLTATLISTV